MTPSLIELHRRGDEARLGGGHGVPLVEVDTDAELVGARTGGLGDLLEGTVTGAATGAEDDVRTLGELLLGLAGAPYRVVERVVGGGVVDGGDGDLGVGGLGARLEALRVLLHRRDLETEHLAELVGLGHQAGEVAGAVARLVLGEDQTGDVLLGDRRRVVALVDADEAGGRVGLGGGGGRVRHQEADRDDRVVLLVGELLDVRRVVLGVLGLDVLVEGVRVLRGGLRALVGGLVERLVVDLAGVGDETDAVDVGGGAVRVIRGRTCRSRAGGGGGVGAAGAAATARKGEGERRRHYDQVTRGLHESSPWRSGQTCRCYGLGVCRATGPPSVVAGSLPR